MKKYFLSVTFLIFAAACLAQNVIDSGAFFLHKFAQNIGKETYVITGNGNELTYEVNFKFTDRGSPVPLKAKLVTNNAHEPISLFIKGSTSRFSTINDSIRIQDKNVSSWVDSVVSNEALKPLSFPVAGYSPGTVQMVLLKYWNTHGQPKSISLLPKGEVVITKDGTETFILNKEPLLLNRYIISGLIWGNEIAWTDAKGNLICLITNDAEGDKLEMMQVACEELPPRGRPILLRCP